MILKKLNALSWCQNVIVGLSAQMQCKRHAKKEKKKEGKKTRQEYSNAGLPIVLVFSVKGSATYHS